MTPDEVLKLLFTGSLFAAVFIFGLERFVEWRRKRRIRKAAKYAMQTEMDKAGNIAVTYLRPESPKAPPNRLSTLLYQDALPKLVSLGFLNHEAAQALITFYNHVDSFNRALDDINEHRSNGRGDLEDAEISRACGTAIMIAPARELVLLAEMEGQPVSITVEITKRLRENGGRTLYDRARSALGFL